MLIFANVAELSAERMEELAGQANLRDAGTTAEIATDKLLALSGDPSLTQTLQNLHLHLQSNDVARQFHEFLHSLQSKAAQAPSPALTDEKPDTEERESPAA